MTFTIFPATGRGTAGRYDSDWSIERFATHSLWSWSSPKKKCLLAVRGITTRQRLAVELSLRGGTVAIRNGVGPICRGDEIGCGKENRTLLKQGMNLLGGHYRIPR